MSKLPPILLCCALLAFSGCPKDEPIDFLSAEDFYGSWSVVQFDSDFSNTGTFLGEDIDQQGSSRITNSALRINLQRNGSWTSSGDYDLVIVTDEGQETTEQEGIGEGTWLFRSDTLFMDGLRNYNGSGEFELAQPFAITDFEREISADFTTSFDQTERDDDLDINIRTQSSWEIVFVR